jgi:hypothetical protein
MTSPGARNMKPDALSGWATSPAAARLAGDWPAFRCFETAEAAMAFVAPLAANAEKQRRYRQRLRDNAVVVRAWAVPGKVITALINSGRLDEKAALDPKQIGYASMAVLNEWSKEWGG